MSRQKILITLSLKDQKFLEQLLSSERMVQMNYIDKISHTIVGKILKENSLKPHLVEEWYIPKGTKR